MFLRVPKVDTHDESLFQCGVRFQLAMLSNCRCIASWKHTPLKQLSKPWGGHRVHQVKILLRINFFNGLTTSESYDFSEDTHGPQLQAF